MTNRTHLCLAFTIALGGFFSGSIVAHTLPDNPNKNTLDINLVSTWRSAAAVDDATAWRLPGFLMGSHTAPVDEGVAIDEFALGGLWAFDPQFYAAAKIGTHGTGKSGSHHSDGIELQHAFVGWQSVCDRFCVGGAMGKMSPLLTPYVGEHASSRTFSEASLIQDVFFGRDFHDQGLRAHIKMPVGISAGLESWRGNAFPATATDQGKNNDAYVRYDLNTNHLSASVGAWAMRAQAENRVDERYSLESQHGANNIPLFPSVRFSGTQHMNGIYSQVHWQFDSRWAFSLEAEWLASTSEGELSNTGSSAALHSKARAMRIEPAIHWRNQSLALRAEQLTTDNYLQGPGAAAINLAANLNTQGHNPERLSLAWQWQYRPNLRFRSEFIQDKSLPDEASRITFGVIWQQSYSPAW